MAESSRILFQNPPLEGAKMQQELRQLRRGEKFTAHLGALQALWEGRAGKTAPPHSWSPARTLHSHPGRLLSLWFPLRAILEGQPQASGGQSKSMAWLGWWEKSDQGHLPLGYPRPLPPLCFRIYLSRPFLLWATQLTPRQAVCTAVKPRGSRQGRGTRV